MTLPLFVVALIALFVAIVTVGALIGWHPHGPATEVVHGRPAPDPVPTVHPDVVDDWCEGYVGEDGWIVKCLATPTHELVGEVTREGDGASAAMVATYCEEHAPTGSVRVRWVEVASAGG
jgi:hypothetical protein